MKNLQVIDRDNIHYYYDNDSGMIYEDLTDMEDIYPEEKKYNAEYLNNYIKCLESHCKKIHKELTVSELSEYYKSNGLTEMILKLTDSCNMRCEYCIYSNHYPYTVTYGDNVMKFDVAKKAIDEYMGLIKQQQKLVPDKHPFVAFYGGEPLLAFETIKEVIDYIEEKYSDIGTYFTITTNGLLLENNQISNYLKSKNVIICLSLDAYKENNDRNRKTITKSPTYDRLIKMVRENFSEYNNIYSLCCIDPRTDLEKLYEFYKTNDRLNGGIIPHVLRFSYIFNIESDYFNQFSNEEMSSYRKGYWNLRKKYIEVAIKDQSDWILDLLIGQEFTRIVDRMKLMPCIEYYHKQGCCVPGDKLYVYPNGTYGICEKVCVDGIDLGNVNNGLDLNKIKSQIDRFNNVLKKCECCEMANLCEVCYSHLTGPDSLGGNEVDCEMRKKHFKEIVKDIIHIEKNNPGYFERKLTKQAQKNLRYASDIQNLLNM
jgi:uncharacterized protein